MAEEYLTLREHDEFTKRMISENEHQNQRLEDIEKSITQISAINLSVERLAVNMENMLKVQLSQGERLEKLESQDGDSWRNLKWLFIAAAVTIAVSFLAYRLGLKGG